MIRHLVPPVGVDALVAAQTRTATLEAIAGVLGEVALAHPRFHVTVIERGQWLL